MRKKKNLPLRAPQKEAVHWIWPAGHSLPTPDLEYAATLKVKLQIILHTTCKVLWTYAFCFSAVKFSPRFLALAQAGNEDFPILLPVTPQNKSSLHSLLQTNKSLVPRLDFPWTAHI